MGSLRNTCPPRTEIDANKIDGAIIFGQVALVPISTMSAWKRSRIIKLETHVVKAFLATAGKASNHIILAVGIAMAVVSRIVLAKVLPLTRPSDLNVTCQAFASWRSFYSVAEAIVGTRSTR